MTKETIEISLEQQDVHCLSCLTTKEKIEEVQISLEGWLKSKKNQNISSDFKQETVPSEDGTTRHLVHFSLHLFENQDIKDDTVLIQDQQKDIALFLIKQFNECGKSYQVSEAQEARQEKAPPLSRWQSFVSFFTSHPLLNKGLTGIFFGFIWLLLPIVGVVFPPVGIYIIAGVSVLGTAYLGYPSYRSAWARLKNGDISNMDVLFAISTIVAIAASIGAFFFPFLPMMFEAPLMIFGFKLVGDWIKTTLEKKIQQGLPLKYRGPQFVSVIKDGKRIKTDKEKLKPGDVFEMDTDTYASLDNIRSHDGILPVDCIALTDVWIRDFKTGKDEARLIKAPHFDEKNSDASASDQEDNILLAGYTQVCEVSKPQKTIQFQVVRTLEESTYVNSEKMITADNNNNKTTFEERSDQIMRYFVPVLFGCSLLSGILVGVFFGPALAIQSAICIIVACCPCVFGVLTSLAIKICMAYAAENKVVLQQTDKKTPAQHLEELSRVDVMLLDINGTLTTGQKEISDIYFFDASLGDDLKKKIFQDVAAIEMSTPEYTPGHTIGLLLSKKCEQQIDSSLVKNTRVSRSGVEADIEGIAYLVGNEDFIQEQKIEIDEKIKEIMEGAQNEGKKFIFIAQKTKNQENNGNKEYSLIGYMTSHEPLREDAPKTVEALQNLHIPGKGKMQVMLCTGDTKRMATYIANKLSIPDDNDHIFHSQTPQKKAQLISELKAKGHITAMFGDGINDKDAMMTCDVGIQKESDGADAETRRHAGAVIKGDGVSPLLALFKAAHQNKALIDQNFFLSIAYNVLVVLIGGGLLLGLGVSIPPALGACLMILESALVLGNAWRVKMAFQPSSTPLSSVNSHPTDHHHSSLTSATNPFQFSLRSLFCCTKQPAKTTHAHACCGHDDGHRHDTHVFAHASKPH